MGQPWRDTSRRVIIKTASVPAPIGGLNSRDSIAAMPITDALVLRNWFPLPYAVSMRKGWQEIVVGMAAGETPTVDTYSPTSGVDVPVVFTGGNIYVITAPGPAPVPAVTGLTSDYWQTTMFNPAGTPYLYCVNGFDSPRYYDGTTFTVPTITSVEPGFDATKFIHIAIHQRRLWFVEKDSMNAWYLPVDQIAGAVEVFPVGQLFKFGGYLMAIYTWTIDAGDGMDDKLVLISSKGEVAIYSGTNPDDATLWTLEGVFRIGSPVGRRCGASYGGDLLLLTSDGAVPLSKSFQSTRVHTAEGNLTDKVRQTITTLITQFGSRVGWMMMLFYQENQAWLVVPALGFNPATGTVNLPDVQVYAMNTISNAWAQYTGMDIRCCCIFNESPIFVTGDGRLCRAWVGFRDNTSWDYVPAISGRAGERIPIEVLTAYNYFEALGQTKRWTMCRPIFQAGTLPSAAIRLEVDFSVTGELPPLAISSLFGIDAIWDDPATLWDSALWGSPFQRYRRWLSLQGMGYAAALHMLVQQSAETLWIATDFVFELGDTI